MNNAYILLQGQFHEQKKKLAWSHLLSPLWLMLIWENWNMKATVNPPRNLKRYVDDTFVIQCYTHKEGFLEHINSVDPSIQFTVEEARSNGSTLFLDTIVTPQAYGTFTTGVCRKLKCTDPYLQWDSHHNIASKHSVMNSLTHRVKSVCSTLLLLKKIYSI